MNRFLQAAGFTIMAASGILLTSSYSFACHADWSTARKILDPAGYVFCSEVVQHLDSSGLAEDEGLQPDEREGQSGPQSQSGSHACHGDCQPPGEGFLMGHRHLVTASGKCILRQVEACQLKELPAKPARPEIPVRRSVPKRLNQGG